MSRHQIFAQKEIVLDSEDLTLFGTDDTSFTYNGVPVMGQGIVSLAPIGSSPNASGASIASHTLTLQPASAAFGGVLTSGVQSISGAKTFTGAITASNLSGTNTGDVTLAAVGSSPNANAASLSSQILTLQPANETNPGVIIPGAQTLGGVKDFPQGVTISTVGTFNGSTIITEATLPSLTVGDISDFPVSQGATIVDNVLYLHAASSETGGVITSGTQSFGGDKTFDLTISAANLSGTNTGDVTLAVVGAVPNANGASLSGQVLTLQPASGTQPGLISTSAQTMGSGLKTFSSGIALSSSQSIQFSNNIKITSTGTSYNTSVGQGAGSSITSATENTLLGHDAGSVYTTDSNNICIAHPGVVGDDSFIRIGDPTVYNDGFMGSFFTSTSSDLQTFIGDEAGKNVTSGTYNVFVGNGSGKNVLTPSHDILLGAHAGINYTSNESDNICIGNDGVLADQGVIRIGTNTSQTSCFVQGISGVTVAGAVMAVIDTNGQLGTIISSKKRKREIVDISDGYAQYIYKLRPVEFKMKEDKTNERNFGLIAEEAKEVFPDMVIDDEQGDPITFQYHKLDGLFIKLFQLHKKELDQEKARVAELKLEMDSLKQRLKLDLIQ